MTSTETLHPGPHLSESLTCALNAAGGRLRVTVEPSGSAVLLSAGGEVDACNVVIWKWVLCEAAGVTPAPGPLVVDTSRLDFMGCCAFAALAEQAAQCRRRGLQLCVVSDQPIVARVLAAGRLEAELPLYRNVDTALGPVETAPPC